MCEKNNQSFMVEDNGNILSYIDHLVEKIKDDESILESIKEYVETIEVGPGSHEYESIGEQLIDEIINLKVDIVKLLIECVEKEKSLSMKPLFIAPSSK